MMRPVLLVALSLLAWLPRAAAEITLEKTSQGVTVKADGQPFTEYVVNATGTRPYLWPLIGPGGKAMTRAYPMQTVEAEKDRDHIHHRSLWFTHGSINGIDFWSEGKGRTVQRELVKAEGGKEGVIVTKNDLLSPDGSKLVCQDERRHRFGADALHRWIDFDITIRATGDPLVFGDTKEGTFAARMASTIRVDSKQGGQIVNSEGQRNGAAWGKPAAWVDYHGPVDGETVGLAILNHPSSFRYPTYWHVRTYGLFAANPFGLNDFTLGAKKGEYTLPSGETLTLRYRVLLHKGDEKAGKVAEAFADYAK